MDTSKPAYFAALWAPPVCYESVLRGTLLCADEKRLSPHLPARPKWAFVLWWWGRHAWLSSRDFTKLRPLQFTVRPRAKAAEETPISTRDSSFELNSARSSWGQELGDRDSLGSLTCLPLWPGPVKEDLIGFTSLFLWAGDRPDCQTPISSWPSNSTVQLVTNWDISISLHKPEILSQLLKHFFSLCGMAWIYLCSLAFTFF